MSPPTKTQLQAHHVHVAPSLQLCTAGGVHAATVPAALQVSRLHVIEPYFTISVWV